MKLLYIITIALAITYTQVFASTLHLNSSQKEIITEVHKYGDIYDLGNTLAGIALVESQLGKYQIGTSSSDYGIMQISIKSALDRMGIENTRYKRSQLATLLITDRMFNYSMAIAELKFWQKKYGKGTHWQWVQMVNSYNNGHHSTNFNYANKVSKAIRRLKENGYLR
jgi:hypothetical protein